MERYKPDVSPVFEVDRVSATEAARAALRWRKAARTLKGPERKRIVLLIAATHLVPAVALAAVSPPLYVWLAWLVAETLVVAAYALWGRSEAGRLAGELRLDTRLLYAAYLAVFRSIRVKGNSRVTAEECAVLMAAATLSKTSLLGKEWPSKPPIPLAREETAVRRVVTLSPEELTDLIHRVLIALFQREIAPHLPSGDVNLIVDTEHIRVTGKKLIRRALDYITGFRGVRHGLLYLRVSVLPSGHASPALPVYITLLKRGEDITPHVLKVSESLRKLDLRVVHVYSDANAKSTGLFNSLGKAGATLVARWTRNEATVRMLTPHLRLEELRAIVNQLSDILERRIQRAEDPAPYIQAKLSILKGNLAVLGKTLAYLAAVDGEFRGTAERFREWMKSLPEAFLWRHTQRSRSGEEARLTVGCVLNSAYTSTLKALEDPETQSIYLRRQKNPRNTRKKIRDREYLPTVFYSGFAAPVPLRDAVSRVWELSLIDLGLRRSQVETEIRESGAFTLDCRSTSPVFRLLVKASGEITLFLWRAARIREAGFKTLTEEKTRKARVLILTENERRAGEPAVVVAGRTTRIQRFAERKITKERFRSELIQEHALFHLVGLSTVLSTPKKPTKPPP